jgi:hypothetical protein
MKKTLVLLALLVSVCALSYAQTTLVPGDIAIIGMNCDNADAFAFVFMVPVQAGTQIIFTDCGWKDDSLKFRSGEGAVTYTAPSALTAGTVVVYDSSTVMPDFVKYTGTVITGNIQFSATGDQIIAFQGSDATPSFIYALNDNDTLGTSWNYAYNSNSSALPTGLIDGTTAFGYEPETDNIVYTGITSGSRSELLAAIGNQANWTGSDASRQTMPTGPFTITGVEGQPNTGSLPGSYALKASPNPAYSRSLISFSLPKAGNAELSIFNIAGQKVATLASGPMSAGNHTVLWQTGHVPQGVYFYQLQAEGQAVTRNIVVLK